MVNPYYIKLSQEPYFIKNANTRSSILIKIDKLTKIHLKNI